MFAALSMKEQCFVSKVSSVVDYFPTLLFSFILYVLPHALNISQINGYDKKNVGIQIAGKAKNKNQTFRLESRVIPKHYQYILSFAQVQQVLLPLRCVPGLAALGVPPGGRDLLPGCRVPDGDRKATQLQVRSGALCRRRY